MKDQEIVLVKDVMKSKVNMIDGLATIRQALEMMKKEKTKTLIVEKQHEYDEYGIIVIPDIAREVLAKGRSPDRVSVYEIMNKPAVTVHKQMHIRYASRLFSYLNLSRAPVVENGKVIGIVSFSDMVLKGLINLV